MEENGKALNRLTPPEHSVDDVLEDIEWRAGCLAAIKEAAPPEMLEMVEELEEIMDYYGLTINDIGDREVYSWAMPWAHMYRMEELMYHIVAWLDPETAAESANPEWLEREGLA